MRKIDPAFNPLLRTSFQAFASRSLGELERKTPRPGKHIDAICRALTAVHEGKLKRLVINQPPRTLKSFHGAVAFPAWKLGHDPSFKVIIACHDARLAETHADKIRQVMRSDFYLKTFRETRLRTDFMGRDQFRTDAGGQVLAVSMGGGVTGHGADLIVVDDPIDAGKVGSAAERQQVIDLFESKLLSRLDSQANGVVLVLQQRLHVDDLSGYLKRRGGFEHLVIPLIAEKDGGCNIGDWIWRRPAGDILDPDENLAEVIADKQRDPFTFAAQYQQDPRPEGEAIVPADCFGTFVTPPPAAHRCVLSFDTATKSTGSSFSVCLVFKTDGRDFFLVDVWRNRVDYDALEAKAVDLAEHYKPALIVIEDASYGGAIKGRLEKLAPGNVLLEKPGRLNKLERLQSVFDVLNAKRVHLPDYAVWKKPFLEEVCAFPGSATDDQVDALSQFLKVMKEVGPQWFTPKVIAQGPRQRTPHPDRDPANLNRNYIPNGRLPDGRGGRFSGGPRVSPRRKR